MKPKQVCLLHRDDEPARAWLRVLQADDYAVWAVHRASAHIGEIAARMPQAIVFDLRDPVASVVALYRELCTDMRLVFAALLVVTDPQTDLSRLGTPPGRAVERLNWPFPPMQIVGRLMAALKRLRFVPEEDIVIGPLTLCPMKLRVYLRGRPLRGLSLQQFRILLALSRHPGQTLTREQMLESTHRSGDRPTPRSIDVNIAGLRKKLGPWADIVASVRGVGYRLAVEKLVESDEDISPMEE